MLAAGISRAGVEATADSKMLKIYSTKGVRIKFTWSFPKAADLIKCIGTNLKKNINKIKHQLNFFTQVYSMFTCRKACLNMLPE